MKRPILAAMLSLLAGLVLLAGCARPTPTPLPTASPRPSATVTAAPVFIPTIAPTPTLVSTATSIPTPTPTPTAAPTITPSPTPKPTATLTPTPSEIVARLYTGKIIKSYPHDSAAFTEGLVYDSGFLYESTGMAGQSSLRQVDLGTGKSLRTYALDPKYFGEGMAIYGEKRDRIVQLTWQEHTGFVYDKASFQLLKTFGYVWEGWGITWDGKRLIMSDGTDTLHFLDPDTLAETGSIHVRDENGPVLKLNELEYVEGLVYANVWLTNTIVIISPDTGRVTGKIDLSEVTQAARTAAAGANIDVLNGIAYDSADRRLFVTGKYWPLLFQIDLVTQ